MNPVAAKRPKKAAPRKAAPSDLEDNFSTLLRYYGLPEPEREFVFAPPRKFRCDFFYKRAGLIIELEGGVWTRGKSGHNSGTGIERDCEKSRHASLHGYRVFRVTQFALNENAGEIMEQLRQILSQWPEESEAHGGRLLPGQSLYLPRERN